MELRTARSDAPELYVNRFDWCRFGEAFKLSTYIFHNNLELQRKSLTCHVLQKGFTCDTCRKQDLSHAGPLNFGLFVFDNKVSRVGSPTAPTTNSLRIASRCQGTLECGCGIDTLWYDVLRMTLADVNAASLRSLCCFQPRKTIKRLQELLA